MGMLSVIEKVEKVSSFIYSVTLVGGVNRTVFIYKSIQSMKETYKSMLEVDGFYVFEK